MGFLARLRFRHKMIAIPIVAGIGFCLVFGVASLLGGRIRESLERIELGYYPAVKLNDRLGALVDDIQRQFQDAVSIEDEEELVAADRLRDEFRELLRAARSNPVLSEQDIDDLDLELVAYYELARRLSVRLIAGDLDEDVTAELQRMKAMYNALQSGLQANARLAQQEIGRAFASARSAERDLAIAIGIILAMCVVALLATVRAVTEGVTAPVSEAMRVADALAQGDLTQGVSLGQASHGSAEAEDEVERLLSALARMTDGLSQLVRGVHDHTDVVTEVATLLHHSTGEMASTVSRQETAVEEANRSIERVQSSVVEISVNVDELSSAAVRAANSASGLDASIRSTVGVIDRHTKKLDGAVSAVAEMTNSMTGIAGSASALVNSADSTNDSLQSLAESVSGVEQAAKETHDLARDVHGQAERGLRKVAATGASMEEIHDGYRGLEEIIRSLAGRSEAIGEINGVIEGVLERTQLLSLNATIIAARAGEHGKAFGVVAREIGDVADRTKSSTAKIHALIETVRKEVRDAAEAMAEGSRQIDAGLELSREAGGLLKEIRVRAEVCSGNVDDIVESTSKQAREIAQVSSAMADFLDLAGRFDRVALEQESASIQIREAMEELGELGQKIRSSSHQQGKESAVIAAVVEEVATRIQQIAAAAEDQARSGAEIGRAVGAFREAVSESSRSAEEVNAIAGSLLERSRDLCSEVQRFVV